MADNIVGTAIYKIVLDDSGVVPGLSKVKSAITDSMSTGTAKTHSLTDGMAQLALGVNALKQAFSGLSSGMSIIGDLTDSFNQYQASMNGVKAVASATGNDVAASMAVVKESISNGLISQADAAAAVKNLEAYGYTAEQAGQMIQVMTDAAVYNRQANYSVSEAVRVTTEGIRMENSVLSDAAGINKNIAKMQEEYAKSLGISTNELSDAQRAQAVYNGVLAEGGVYAGNAEEYTHTLAGAQNQLGTALETTKANLGSLFDAFAPVISTIADFITHNQELVVAVATAVGVLMGGYGLISAFRLVKEAISKVSESLAIFNAVSAGASGNFAKMLTVLGSVGVGIAAANMISNLTAEEERYVDVSERANLKMTQQGEVADKTSSKIAKLKKQLSNLTRDYERDLKQIAVNHEENLATLQTQIEGANIDYQRAIDERMASFNVTMAKQEKSHQETVDELMGQLAFLQRYNNDYNKQKLAQVEFALAKEQALYQQQTEAQQAEIDLQNQADKEKLDAKLASLQQELEDELAFMEKHREDLNSVRKVILLDEVESLKERYAAQKANYAEQIAEAGKSGQQSADNFDKAFNDTKALLKAKIQTDYSKEGQKSAESYGSGFNKGFVDYIGEGGPAAGIWKAILGEERYNRWTSGKGLFYGGWATGGYTGRGDPDEVAGVVHKGEYVIPASQVNQNTGLPKDNPGGGDTFIINVSGVLATSPQAKRELAAELQQALAQTKQARLS